MGTIGEMGTSVGGSVDRDSRLDHANHERDPLYLFACHLEWHTKANIKAYQEIVAALDDRNPEIRAVAESLLHRLSPRPDGKLITHK